jgi:hypothetical protein
MGAMVSGEVPSKEAEVKDYFREIEFREVKDSETSTSRVLARKHNHKREKKAPRNRCSMINTMLCNRR